jgi:hypothetical protein
MCCREYVRIVVFLEDQRPGPLRPVVVPPFLAREVDA